MRYQRRCTIARERISGRSRNPGVGFDVAATAAARAFRNSAIPSGTNMGFKVNDTTEQLKTLLLFAETHSITKPMERLNRKQREASRKKTKASRQKANGVKLLPTRPSRQQ